MIRDSGCSKCMPGALLTKSGVSFSVALTNERLPTLVNLRSIPWALAYAIAWFSLSMTTFFAANRALRLPFLIANVLELSASSSRRWAWNDSLIWSTILLRCLVRWSIPGANWSLTSLILASRSAVSLVSCVSTSVNTPRS